MIKHSPLTPAVLLTRALRASDWEGARSAVDAGAPIDGETPLLSPLLVAAQTDSLEAAQWLLKLGANPNGHASPFGAASTSPLFAAAESGMVEMCELLLQNGADPLAVDLNDNTALHRCCASGHPSSPFSERQGAIRALALGGVPIEAQQNRGLTALMLCCLMGEPEWARALLEMGADVDARSGNNRSGGNAFVSRAGALGLLMQRQATDPQADGLACLEALFEFNADPFLKDANGATPMDWAAMVNNGRARALFERANLARSLGAPASGSSRASL